MSTYVSKTKDPDEDLDYSWSFGALLETGETIVSYVLTPESPLTLHDDSNDNTTVTAWVSPGGVSGTDKLVACKITTSEGRIFERSIRFRLVTK